MKVRYDMIACFVVRPDSSGALSEVLQLRRAPHEFLGGAWSTVRGKMEAGEKAWESALRELREETGLRPRAFFQLDTVDVFYLHGDDTLWHCPGFCAVIDRADTVTLNDEHDAMHWVIGRAL